MGQHCCPNFLDSCLSADFEVAGVVSVFLLCRLPKTRVLLCYSLCLAIFDHPAQILPIEAPLAIGVWAREPRPWAQHGHRHAHGHGHKPGHGHGHWRGQIRPKQKKTSLKYLMNQAWNANPFSQLASHSPLAERFLFMELTLHPPKNFQFTELVGQMRADHG